MRVKTNLLRILFLKQRKVSIGVSTYQNIMLHIFDENPNSKLIVTEAQPKIGNKFFNSIYEFIQSIRIIHILVDYIYLMLKAIKFRKKVDYLFITHHFKYGLFAISMSSLFRIPFIVPILGWAEKELRLRGTSKVELFVRLKYEYWVLKKAKCILSSYDLTNEYAKAIKNRNKFLNIDSPIDTNKFKPAPKSDALKTKLDVDNKNIIFTAAPLWGVKGKGIKTLLKAFVLIKKECSNVVLLVAGDGRERKELEDLAKNLNVKNDVIFLGYRNNIPELLNLADVFALIFSFGGGIGLAIKEAMACEKPCVVSKTSGTKALNNGEEVLLASLDPKEIADKILLLLQDEEYARKIGINARKRIESDFSIEKAGEKLFNKLSEDRLP